MNICDEYRDPAIWYPSKLDTEYNIWISDDQLSWIYRIQTDVWISDD